jgi:chromosome segregation ATPase
MRTPVDDELQAKREALGDTTVEEARLDTHREQMAASVATLDRERERVAHTRGRLQERRENGGETDQLQAELDDALRELTEAETDAIAATQRYDSARQRLRERRERRERQFRLEDEIANLERRARSHLVDQLHDEYRATLASMEDDTDLSADLFDVDPVTGALAVVRLGDLSAPVVLAVDRFDSTEDASDWLDAPVVHI